MNKEDLKVIEGGLSQEEAINELEEDLKDENLSQEITSQEDIEKFYEENKELVDMIGGLEVFETILQMDDEQFIHLAPSFFQIFNDALHEENAKTEILAVLSSGEINIATLEEEATQLYFVINEIEDISRPKKDFLKRIIGMIINVVKECGYQVPIQIPCQLEEGVKLPIYVHNTDAGLDIYAREEITIAPGETRIIGTGIRVAIPDGYALLIQPRSGQSAKTKLRIANTPGLIDAGYRDEIGVIIENIEPPFKDITYDFDENGEIHITSILHGQSYTISEGQRFAQMRLVQVPKAAFVEVESVGEIGEDRGGGFGSTGIIG